MSHWSEVMSVQTRELAFPANRLALHLLDGVGHSSSVALSDHNASPSQMRRPRQQRKWMRSQWQVDWKTALGAPLNQSSDGQTGNHSGPVRQQSWLTGADYLGIHMRSIRDTYTNLALSNYRFSNLFYWELIWLVLCPRNCYTRGYAANFRLRQFRYQRLPIMIGIFMHSTREPN